MIPKFQLREVNITTEYSMAVQVLYTPLRSGIHVWKLIPAYTICGNTD